VRHVASEHAKTGELRRSKLRELSRSFISLPPEQEAIRAKCFHPTGNFVEFAKEEIEQSIPERFEKIARQFPERIAVKSKQNEITYDRLNRAANRLARAIVARRGHGQEPIALFLNDGTRLITAHLAVLKTGKFSLAVDPSGSQPRTVQLLDDSGAAFVVTEAGTASSAQQRVDGGRIFNMDHVDSTLSEENLGLPVSPSDYCYLRYTSGSTGQSKGGLKTHRHVMHAVMNATNYFHICAEDRSVLLTRDACFGKYAFEVLLNGAALFPFYIAQEGLSPLADWLLQEQITFYYSFPTAFRHFLNALSNEAKFPKLRLIRLEGEPLYKSDVELYRKQFSSDCLLVNSFSSTETGPMCLYFLDKESDVTGTCVPAGYPVDGMRVLLLDEMGKELGPNQAGEIAVRSLFLSSGYWQRPELTKQKFLAETQITEERVYLTGDLGQWSEDGCLELLGRKDFQVKVRSFRVDIGEVEAVLALHPEVKEVSVVGKKDPSGNTKLIAYFVPHSQPAPTISSLRKFLKQSLSEYMIPAAFVTLDRLPLLSTGKVDRRALPEVGNARPELDIPFVAPRTPVETELAQIWAKVLSVEQVGIHDRFFDLGGHSLNATQVVSQVIKQFQIEVPLQSIFESPTVAEMAAVITEHQARKIAKPELERILIELESVSEEKARQSLADATGTKSNEESE